MCIRAIRLTGFLVGFSLLLELAASWLMNPSPSGNKIVIPLYRIPLWLCAVWSAPLKKKLIR